MRMKPILIGIALSITACSTKTDKPAQVDAPAYTLIFMDKSLSVHTNQQYVGQKYQQALSHLVDQQINHQGDKIAVYFIHENTAKGRALTLTARSEMEDVSHASPTDRETAQASFDLMLQRERTLMKRQLLAKLAQQNTGSSNQETDIWASLPLIAKAGETGATVRVYYLSDMVESMTGPGRRDFHKRPPATDKQATEWAKTDAEKLKVSPLNAADITLLLPFEPNASRRENNPTITTYWQTLFAELGAGAVAEE